MARYTKTYDEEKIEVYDRIQALLHNIQSEITELIQLANEVLPVTICKPTFHMHEWSIRFMWELDHWIKRFK